MTAPGSAGPREQHFTDDQLQRAVEWLAECKDDSEGVTLNNQRALASDLQKARVALASLRAQNERLREAAQMARSVIDKHMGDSDIEGDDSPEMRAMQALSAALASTDTGESRDG